MARRLLVLTLLVAGLALAGCVGQSPSPPSASKAPLTQPIAQPPAHAGGATMPPPSVPSGFFVTDGGQIQGPFTRSWPFKVSAVGFQDALVEFNLTGVQPSLPPTARLHLSLVDATGKELKGEDLGLGAQPSLKWVLGPLDLPKAGTYTLKATSAPGPAPVPGGGAAQFALYAAVTY